MLVDVVKPGLYVLFCGTAVGNESAKKGIYYANPTNKFWSVLYCTGITPIQIVPMHYLTILQYGVGLTDLVKVQSGNDPDIKDENYDSERLIQTVIENKPKWLCFNGKKAAKVFFQKKVINYGVQKEKVGQTKIFVAPSTSATANRYWNEEHWFNLSSLIKKDN